MPRYSDVYQTLIKITKSGKKKPVQIVYNLMPSPVSLQVRPHCKFFFNFKMGRYYRLRRVFGTVSQIPPIVPRIFLSLLLFGPPLHIPLILCAYSMFSVTPHHSDFIFQSFDRFSRTSSRRALEPPTGLLRVRRGYRHDFSSPHLSFSTEIMLVYLFFSS